MKLGLARAPRNALIKSWCLSLVPPDRWPELLALIQRDLDDITPRFPQAQAYSYYLRTQWLPLAHIVTAGIGVRANSIAEGWNHWAVVRFGVHPMFGDSSVVYHGTLQLLNKNGQGESDKELIIHGLVMLRIYIFSASC